MGEGRSLCHPSANMERTWDGAGKEVICILGMHRSGTSMVSHLLHLCGLDLGPEQSFLPPDAHNSGGYFENDDFTYQIDDPLLVHLGGTWDNPPRLEKGWEFHVSLEPFVQKAESLLQAFSGSPRWGWKDPRTTILLPFWQRLIPNLRFVICIRSPLEVAKSLARRDRMPMEQAVHLWNHYNRVAIRETEGSPRIFLFYEDFFNQPIGELCRLVRFCDLQLPPRPVRLFQVISSALRHHARETCEILNDGQMIGEHKLFYLGLRALVREGFAGPVADGDREACISENISSFLRLLETFHDEQELVRLQSALLQAKLDLRAHEEQLLEMHETSRRAGEASEQRTLCLMIALQTRIEQLRGENRQLTSALKDITESLDWRIITGLHNLKDRILPAGSRRRDVYNVWSRKKLKVLMHS